MALAVHSFGIKYALAKAEGKQDFLVYIQGVG